MASVRNLFFELHQDLSREAPGDNFSTEKALAFLSDLPSHPLFLDIGCGPGAQTLALAQATQGHVIAVDTHQPFLERLQQHALKVQGGHRVSPLRTSIFVLPFGKQVFNAIWAEGAIYIIGFTEGLRAWQRFLKPGGYIAVSELAWLRPQPPAEAVSFWQTAYPSMQTHEENLQLIRRAGYSPIAHFVLPEESWWANYYTPLEGRIAALREKYRGDVAANQQLDEAQREIDLYRQYADWYGYVFYIMQKT